MVAYYALLSLFPFVFLILSALGLTGHVSQSSYLIREMERILPSESVDDLVRLTRSVQNNAGTFFVAGLHRHVLERARLLLGARVGAEHRVPVGDRASSRAVDQLRAGAVAR